MNDPTYVNDGDDPFGAPAKPDLFPKTELQRKIIALYAKHHVKRFKNLDQLKLVQRIERKIASNNAYLSINAEYVQWVLDWVKSKLALNQYIPMTTLINMCIDAQRENDWKAKKGKVVTQEEVEDYGEI